MKRLGYTTMVESGCSRYGKKACDDDLPSQAFECQALKLGVSLT